MTAQTPAQPPAHPPLPKFPKIRLAEVDIDLAAAGLLGHEYALRFLALPISLRGNHLLVAMCEPHNKETVSRVADVTGRFVLPAFAEEADLRLYIDTTFGEQSIDEIATNFLLERHRQNHGDTEISDELIAEISSTPTVQFIDTIIRAAILNRASDVHIEPYSDKLRVRFRIDGRLVTHKEIDASLLPNVISRLKIMGGINIAEKRLPQDGHFTLDENTEIRISTLKTIYGEKAVLRLLRSTRLKKNELGFFEEELSRLTELFNRPHGAIFMTGPTGSGKSTTLNCFLEELNNEAANIVTIEDPVENPILGVNHVNIEKKTVDFATALRHILRQDPDIIMLGEIRDKETAKIAIQAAITGHVVLSTLHTNDAAGVIERLCDMGIEPYLTASALNGIISQRLVRRICGDCAFETRLTTRQSQLLDLPESTVVYAGKGCSHCHSTGFRSRFAVYEYIIIDDDARTQIRTQPAEFSARLRKQNLMRKNALRSLLGGQTSAEEVIRALNR